MKLNQKWSNVPNEHLIAWQQLFNCALTQKSIQISGSCPVCGAQALYRYYTLGKLQPLQWRGVMYKGTGSCWEWCSKCHSYEHSLGFVPLWWTVELPGLDHSKLTVIPDLIDEAINSIFILASS